MPYQSSREGEWASTTAWHWGVNMLALAAPDLFGCRKTELPKIKSARQIDNIGDIVRKLGGEKVAENQNASKGRIDTFYRLQGRPIVLIVERDKPVKLIAPKAFIEHVNSTLKEFLG